MGAAASAASFSEDFSRAGRWEVYGMGQAIKIFEVLGSDSDVFGGGLGVGYNISEHFNVNADFSISSENINQPSFLGTEAEGSRTLYMGNLALDYNILKTPVTPVLSIGGGVGVPSEGSGTLYDGTIGAGVRWDATERLFVKALLRGGVWKTTEEGSESWGSIGATVVLGYRF